MIKKRGGRMTQYKIGDLGLVMRDKASFRQVRDTFELLTRLKIEELSAFDIITKLGDNIGEFMRIVFYYEDKETVESVEWTDLDFDLIIEIASSFLSSSEQLKKLAKIIQTIFLPMVEKIRMQESSGLNIMDGNASSIEQPEESGANEKIS